MIRNIYVHVRRRVPTGIVQRLRGNPTLLAMAKRFQPRPEQLLTLAAPLAGYRMRVPQAWSYPMAWGTYEPDMCQLIQSYLSPGMRVLDIGAHIGYHTLLMKKQVGPTGEVVAFEPLPENRKLLYTNLALNSLEHAIRIEPFAVADQVSLERLTLGPSSSQARLNASDDGAFCIVAACSIDAYCALLEWPRIDAVKMDIEGAETRAIVGMRETLQRWKPILLIEAHGPVADRGLQILVDQDYQLFQVTDDGKVHPDDHIRPLKHGHWLALPPGKQMREG